MNEFGLLQRANSFTLNATAIKTKLLQFVKHDYDIYLNEIVMLVARTLNIILKIPQNCGTFLHQVEPI